MIDSTVLSQWFDAHAAALVLYARQWLDPQGAQDVVHDVFLHLFSQDAAPENPKAWLFRAVRNAALSAIRSQGRRRRRERELGHDQSSFFDPQLDQLVDARAAQAALASLSPDLREITVLRIWGSLSFADIAAIMNRPLSTVFSQYQSALSEIRKIMESQCQTKTS